MNNFYYKNRTLLYIIFTISIVYTSNMLASSAALSVEKGLDIVNSEDIEDVKLINISIPQGSSATDITSSVFSNSLSGIVGNLSMYCLSTENPTPVPFISIYNTSSNALGLSIGI